MSSEIATERREQILGAAVACFGRRGFHRATMPEICAEASLSPGTVYRYFRSKEDLIEALVEADLAASLEFLDQVRRSPTTFGAMAETVDAVLAELADPVGAALQVEIVAEASRNPRIRAAVERHDRQVVGALAKVVEAGQARGEVDRAVDPEAVATLVVALLDGLTARKAVASEVDLDPYAGLIKGVIASLLQPTIDRQPR